MTWLRLDDNFADHPKVSGLSDAAFRLAIRALCYASRHLTDGRIPSGEVATARGRRAAGELEAAGLWERESAGWRIHDYLEWNPSRSSVLDRRQADVERKRSENSERSPGGLRSDSIRPPRGRARVSHPIQKNLPTVGVDLVSDSSSPEGKSAGGSAAPDDVRGANGKAGPELAAVLNVGLVFAMTSERPEWESRISEPFLRALTFGGTKIPAFGALAVNGALADLYESRAEVDDPAAYLRARASARAESNGD